MIRTEKEYQEALERLAVDRQLLVDIQMRASWGMKIWYLPE